MPSTSTAIWTSTSVLPCLAQVAHRPNVGKLGKNMHKLAILANGKIGKNLRQISWRQEVTEFPLQKTVLFPGKYKDSRCSSQLRAQHRLGKPC